MRFKLHVATFAAVAFALASAGWAALTQGETYDEPDHLAWSRRLLETGETDRDFLRFNSKTPAVMANVALRKLARRAGIRDPPWLRFAARAPGLAWLAALLAVVFALARAAFTPEAAHVATILAALDPNLTAHASVVGVDEAYACATLLTLFAAWRFAERPSPPRALAVGAALGLAFAVKFTAPILLAGLALLLVARPWARCSGPQLSRVAGLLLVAAAVSVLVIDAFYLGAGVAARLSEREWKSPLMTRLALALPGLRLPLPIDFLTGLDSVIGSERAKSWNVVILGRLYPDGVWFYFVLLWLLKTPLFALLASVLGLLRALRARLLLRPLPLFLALNLLLHLGYFSLVFRTQVGYRYALMCVPLGYVLASAGLAPLLAARAGALAGASVVATALAESLVYLGNPLAFTNAAVQPKREVFRLIADSNVDWGQNDEKIRGLLEARGLQTALDPPHVVPGHNTIGLNLLAGVAAFERHRWVRENLDPGGHFGHTYLWFDVTPLQYERFLNEARTLLPREADRRLCEEAPGALLVDGAPLVLSPDRPGGGTPLLCFEARADAQLELRADSGVLALLRAGSRARAAETVDAGQRLVFRLRRGAHAFLVVRERGFEGAFGVSGGPLALRTRTIAADPRGIPRGLAAEPGADSRP